MSTGSDEIERQSEEHRAAIAMLVDELRDRVTPGEIANQLLGPDAGRDLMRMAGSQLHRQLRRNPVPVAVITVGVAWLIFANVRRNQRQIPLHDGLEYEEYFESSPYASQGILGRASSVISRLRHSSSAAHVPEVQMATATISEIGDDGQLKNNPHNGGSHHDSASESRGFVGRTVARGREGATHLGQSAVKKAKDAAGRTQHMATALAHTALEKSEDALSGARQAVGNTASSLMERTNNMARRTGRAAGNTASRASSGIGTIAREQPLLVAGIGFALGVALGALLPLSRMENEMLGEQAERLKDSAKELASDGYEKVKSVAQRSYEAAADTLKSATEGQSGSTSGSESSTQTSGAGYGTDTGGDNATNTYHH